MNEPMNQWTGGKATCLVSAIQYVSLPTSLGLEVHKEVIVI